MKSGLISFTAANMPKSVEASSQKAALVKRNNTGPRTERSMAARRRLSVLVSSWLSSMWIG